MKATAKLKNLTSKSDKPIIVRNLSKIMDVRIVEIDAKDSKLNFVCDSKDALRNVKNELKRIGFPIIKCRYQFSKKSRKSYDSIQNEMDTVD